MNEKNLHHFTQTHWKDGVERVTNVDCGETDVKILAQQERFTETIRC